MDTKREHAVGEGPAPAREEPPSTPAPLLVRGRPAPPHLRCRRARLPTVREPHVGDRDRFWPPRPPDGRAEPRRGERCIENEPASVSPIGLTL